MVKVLALTLASLSFGQHDYDVCCKGCYCGKEEFCSITPSLATFEKAIVAACLPTAWNNMNAPDGYRTLFAPTNEAFAALPEGVLEMLLKPDNVDQLVDVLNNHLLLTYYLESFFKDGEYPTVIGQNLTVRTSPLRVGTDPQNLHLVSVPDNICTNGPVHIIDGVLLPPSLQSTLV